jgi:hypothetical protein
MCYSRPTFGPTFAVCLLLVVASCFSDSGGGGGTTFGTSNNPPIAGPDTARTPTNQNITIPVFDNDSDIEGDPIELIYVDTISAQGGSMIGNGATLGESTRIQYSPLLNFRGPDSFSYSITDNIASTNATGLVTVFVGDNDPPVAGSDLGFTSELLPVTVDIFANDSDPDGDSFTIVSLTQPSNGLVQVSKTELTYSPFNGFKGGDSCTYTIEDTMGEQGVGTVFFIVHSALRFTADDNWRLQEGAKRPRVGANPSNNNIYMYFQALGTDYRSIATDGLTFPTSASWNIQDNANRSFDPRMTEMPTQDPPGTSIQRIFSYDDALVAFTSLDSADATSFIAGGTVYTPDGATQDPIGGSTSFKDSTGQVFLLYLGQEGVDESQTMRRAVSSDNGLSFALDSANLFSETGAASSGNVNPMVVPLGLTGFRCLTLVVGESPPDPPNTAAGTIHSWISGDGSNWIDEGAILTTEDFSTLDIYSLGNPHMVALPSGGWRIYCDAMDASGTFGIVSAWSL